VCCVCVCVITEMNTVVFCWQVVSVVMILLVTPKLLKVASWTIVGTTAFAALLAGKEIDIS